MLKDKFLVSKIHDKVVAYACSSWLAVTEAVGESGVEAWAC